MMGPRDLCLQKTFIRQAFHAKQSAVHISEKSTVQKRKTIPRLFERDFLQKALKIGLDLKKQSFQSRDGSLGWICLEPHLETEQYQLLPIGDSLFAGRIGIALFFASLFCLSQEKKWGTFALNTLKPLRKRIERGEAKLLLNAIGIGGMFGIGGIIYGLFHIGRILNFPPLLTDAKKILSCIEEKHIRKDQKYDLIFGSAGLLLALHALYKHKPNPQILALMESCGKHLQENARDLGKGCLGWHGSGEKPLLGFSHGAAGIAFALFSLAALTNQSAFKESAQGALLYEREHFCPKEKNWPRLNGRTFLCSWCHGATGIGLGRLASFSLSEKDPEILKEIEVAIETSKKTLHQGPLSLCCGTLGRLEFLKEAAQVLAKKDLENTVQKAIPSLFHETQEEFYHPGFMQGAAGVGYTLLRLLDKKNLLPQVLLFQ